MKKEFKWHWWSAEVVNVSSDIFSTNNLHCAVFLQCTIESWNPFWRLTQPRPAGFICSASVDRSEKRSYASNSPFRTDKKASNANGHKIKEGSFYIMLTDAYSLLMCVPTQGWEWVSAPSGGVQECQGLVYERRRKREIDRSVKHLQ